MSRPRYIKDAAVVRVDRSILKQILGLRKHKGEPCNEVIKRLLGEHQGRRM